MFKSVARFWHNHIRIILSILLDCAVVFVLLSACYFICSLDMYDIGDAITYWKLVAIAIPTYLGVFTAMGLYKNLWSYAQPREYLLSNLASIVAGILFYIIVRLADIGNTPVFAFFAFNMFAVSVGTVSVRLFYRAFKSARKAKHNPDCKRVMVIGCGAACSTLLNEIAVTKDCNLLPVVGIDDDESKIGCTICGMRIEGGNEDIVRLAKKHQIDLILVAIPSADNAHRARILDFCQGSGCEIKMLPRLHDFHDDDAGCIQKLRDITPEELLGREPININNTSLAGYIAGKTVMVTGGGGSIGSELCRPVARFNPKKLIIVDIYENNAYEIQKELIRTYGHELDLEVHIASVRDKEHLAALMRRLRPQLVIHAAAHKHVPLMEDSPTEAVKNNIIGTLNAAEAAIAADVDRFIMISTDKAVNPTNVMGASKRVCELIVESMNGCGTDFCAVRFGNVLGSNGSVIPLFKNQIEAGGPVTVTHPEITRFFMTIPEAVQLVLAAGSMAKGGEIFVLNMGEPVRIADLAAKMIRLSGYEPDKDIDIEYTGLRPGEKLYEELLTREEGLSATENEKIFIGRPTHIDTALLYSTIAELRAIALDETLTHEEQDDGIEELLLRIVPEFKRFDPKKS